MTDEKQKLNWYAVLESGSMTAVHNIREYIKRLETENEQLKQIIKTACKNEEFVCDLLTAEQYKICKKMGLCK